MEQDPRERERYRAEAWDFAEPRVPRTSARVWVEAEASAAASVAAWAEAPAEV